MNSPLLRARLESPIGPITLLASARGLAACDFGDHTPGAAARAPSEIVDGTNEHLAAARAWLEAYFAGHLDLPGLRPPRPSAGPQPPRPAFDLLGSEFCLAVWRALCEIPPGRTESYGGLAARLGRPGAARAVGKANHDNPIGILIPCHRVVGADGRLTGYAGGLPVKEWLLAHERRHARPAVGEQLAFPA